MHTTTIATHAPTPAQCERLDWLFHGNQMQSWYTLYAAVRGRYFADLALAVHIGRTEAQLENCQRWEKESLCPWLWQDVGAGFQAKLEALQAVRDNTAAAAA